jgi:hypothetical protein
MTDRDITEASINPATLRAFHDAIATLRMNKGIIQSEQTIRISEAYRGVTGIMVGEAQRETPTQFVVVLKEPRDTVPIDRDVHIVGERGLVSFRMEREYTDEELKGKYAFELALELWRTKLADLSGDEKLVEEMRFEVARESIAQATVTLNELKDLNALGKIDDAEFDKQQGEIPINYALEPTDADQVEGYHDTYVSLVYAYHAFQIIIDGVVRDADCELADIIDGNIFPEEDVYLNSLAEGQVWNIISLLDGVKRNLQTEQSA